MYDIIHAVENGDLDEAVLDQRLDELLNVIFSTHQATEDAKGKTFDVEAHHNLARKAAEESIVLLKNEDQILPLKPGTKVAVIGDFAKVPRYQGAGSAIEMPWYPYVKGIVHGYLGGQAGASAMMNVLTGKVNPSGKLNETYPLHYEDTPAYAYYPSKERSSEYRESLYVGYRYYTTVGKSTRFPFGYGLSYTTFEYKDLKIDTEGVTFTIKNTGNVSGTEIAQLYVGKSSETVFRPVRELKGFVRVELQPGEEKEVRIGFDDKTFRFYDTRTDSWEIESGTYQIMIGENAQQMVLEGALDVKGTVENGGYKKEELPEYFSGKIKDISDEKFRILYGKEIPDGSWSGEIRMNDAVCQLYYGKGILGKLLCAILKLLLKISDWKGKPNLNVLFNYNMPIRGYAKMTGGIVTMKMAEALTEMANGHRIKGTVHLIKAAINRE